MISVLHQLPPPETSLRRRSVYRALDTEDIASSTTLIDDVDTVVQDTIDETESVDEREFVQQEGWMDLLYSFWASGIMTVSSPGVSVWCLSFFPQLAAYFFPIVFSVPLFGKYLAREWLWSFTPSLSYVGQGMGSFLRVRHSKFSL